MAVSMADISKLRKLTGAGMMDCKNALNETNNDIEAAIEIIRKKGQAVAAKREDREAAEGCALSANNGDFAAIIALKCETDFVAKNEGFVALTQQLLDTAIAARAKSLEEVLSLSINGQKVSELIVEEIGKTGEKMELGAYEFIEAPSTTSYNHLGNKLATIVGFNIAGVDLHVGRDIAMQVASMNPVSVNRDEVPEHIAAQELEIGREKARQEGKPEAILDRIAEGRLNKFYKESVLMEQEYVKDASLTIEAYLKKQNPELKATTFKRVNLNED
ncbi:MAG: translation elongation factor Ts [Muribaculaceae bacterium]